MNHQITDMELPRHNGELIFAAPWEARAFGLAVALSEKGTYAWRLFSEQLAAQIAAAEQRGETSTYYEHWLAAVEKVVLDQGLVSPKELERRIEECVRQEEHGHDEHGHHH